MATNESPKRAVDIWAKRRATHNACVVRSEEAVRCAEAWQEQDRQLRRIERIMRQQEEVWK
jgi:hypothetical protein